MYMKDWAARLDDFLGMAGNEVLDHAGKVSHETALRKAAAEYDRYKEARKNDLSEVEKDFINQLESAEKTIKPAIRKKTEGASK